MISSSTHIVYTTILISKKGKDLSSLLKEK
nr:MAG TPA: hypothetical protein [Caudoviricetes sp.]